ncbi:thiopeptide-type bacteriocin biosynthesis protein [Streptomyces sp. NPDC050610]|uniref:thiopeptide-type bacteriocin biosynthesis protein n=1 Tax=Streptomyces sp. NPDC050610 TaxID=3157097 RepID=UPI003442A0B6
MNHSADTRTVEKAVLAVLTGTPLHTAAVQAEVQPAALADAVELYRSAGTEALANQATTEAFQAHIEFTEWNNAEYVAATQLVPTLRKAEQDGVLKSWWYVRKHPCWRLRCWPAANTAQEMATVISSALNGMQSEGLIIGWTKTIYEPETHAFGGPTAIGIAHQLFHADSRSTLDYLQHHDPNAPSDRSIGRREMSALLCGTLLRAAGQERYEQADVWNRIVQMRPLPAGAPIDRLNEMAVSLQRLMSVDTNPASLLFDVGMPLAFTTPWIAAFDLAGQRLRDAMHSGTLERGLRAILAHHVIFHWNRLGLADTAQGVFARAAQKACSRPMSLF